MITHYTQHVLMERGNRKPTFLALRFDGKGAVINIRRTELVEEAYKCGGIEIAELHRRLSKMSWGTQLDLCMVPIEVRVEIDEKFLIALDQ